MHARTDNVHVIMITSAGIGEGKTSLASQLAASLARSWSKTLLIDGDLRHPATHTLFKLPLEPGFSEVLRGEASAGRSRQADALSRLWLMPAGHCDAHAVQALAQDNVGRCSRVSSSNTSSSSSIRAPCCRWPIRCRWVSTSTAFSMPCSAT